MTNSPSDFPGPLESSPLPGAVVANDQILPVMGQGNLTFSTEGGNVPLKAVQLIPGLNGPLLSPGVLAKDGYQIVFGATKEKSFIAKEGDQNNPLVHMDVI